LRRIAEVSLQNGGYLSDKEEKDLMEGLEEIKEGLYSGNLKHSQIPFFIIKLSALYRVGCNYQKNNY
jgi:hypothetical protein